MADYAFASAAAEIWLLAASCLLLIAATMKISPRLLHYASIAGLLIAAAIVLMIWPTARVETYRGLFVVSEFVSLLKMGVLLAAAGALAYCADYLNERSLLRGEYGALALFAVQGMLLLIAANSFITVYLGLELMSLSLYAMIAMRRDNSAAVEAAMKYFVLGALASGLLLYGMSMLYGATGSLFIPQVAEAIADADDEAAAVLALGLVFVVVGCAFKLGAAPFHMWLPDVYHGAPVAVTLFIGSAPKIAALAMLLRMLAEAAPSLVADWSGLLAVVAVASLAIGNVAAIAQENLKRMLAYSAIAHSGFVLLGVIAGSDSGYAAATFYIFAYALMTVGGFGMIVLLSRVGADVDRLTDLRGMAQRNGVVAALIAILMLSMAGIPPVVGFYAKFAVIEAVIAAGWLWLAVVAVLFSVVGAFYYLRIIKLMYFEEPETGSSAVRIGTPYILIAAANGAMVVLLGILPGAVMSVCIRSVSGM